jgi:hypothetical protein
MVDLDSMYSAACIKKDKDLDMQKILEFINFIQSVEIDEKYKPFEKPFIHLDEREDIEGNTVSPLNPGFIVIDRVL